MELNDLIAKFSDTTENQRKAIFSTLFIAGNKLQTLFDSRIPEVSLKQFMLLSIVRQSKEQLTFTQLGNLLGCSRQNVKKLADVLAKKGFITIQQSPHDTRAMCICPTDKEIETLFILLSKLYAGIENLECKTANEKMQNKKMQEVADTD